MSKSARFTQKLKDKARTLIGDNRSDLEIAAELEVDQRRISEFRKEIATDGDRLNGPRQETLLVGDGVNPQDEALPAVPSSPDESSPANLADEACAGETNAVGASSEAAVDELLVASAEAMGALQLSDTTPVAPIDAAPFLAPPVAATSQTWLLATNHLNMAYMLSAGLLTGPAGFGGKHYCDASVEFPGWLPVFRNVVPEDAIEVARKENKAILQPCIAEVNIGALCGEVRWIARDGTLQGPLKLPTAIHGDLGALLLRTPLPTSCVKRLWFGSEGAKSEFERLAWADRTISLDHIQCEPAWPAEASAAQPIVWSPATGQPDPAHADEAPARGQAIGGALAMLYHLANRSELLAAAYRITAGNPGPEDAAAIQRDPILKELPAWLAGRTLSKDGAENARLYWGAIDALIGARIAGSTPNAIDAVLEFLDGPLAVEAAPTLHPRLRKLSDAMRGAFGMTKGTNTELLKNHPGSLSRPLLLMCLRERCEDLLELAHLESKDERVLNDEEIALAAILFGVRDGWRKLPPDLRYPEALARLVMHRMVEVEQRRWGSRALTLEPPPPRLRPLRELILKNEGAWSEESKAAFVAFARKIHWPECIVARIRLPEGKYELAISEKTIEFTFRGFLDAYRNEVDLEALLARMSRWPALPREVEAELRDLLANEGA